MTPAEISASLVNRWEVSPERGGNLGYGVNVQVTVDKTIKHSRLKGGVRLRRLKLTSCCDEEQVISGSD
jgi:hypothetical protein